MPLKKNLYNACGHGSHRLIMSTSVCHICPTLDKIYIHSNVKRIQISRIVNEHYESFHASLSVRMSICSGSYTTDEH